MNVVIVNDYAFVNGGASKVAISTAVGLAERGLSVTFFCGVGPVDQRLASSSVSIQCLNRSPYAKTRGSLIKGIWDRDAKAALDRLLSTLSEPLVHVHSHRDSLSNSVLASPLQRNAPLIYTCHEYGLACPYAGFFDHRADAICTRKPLSSSCLLAHCNRKGYDKKLWTYARGAVQNGYLKLPNHASDIIFVSDFSRNVLEPFVGAGVRKHSLSNPYDAPREKRRLSQDSPFLFVGLLTPGKDPLLAARAALNANVRVKFIGDGELREQVLAENPQAEVTGWLAPEQVRREMLHARAIVLDAKWFETQGLAVQEAAAMGVPAIVSRTCAAADMIDDGITGVLVDAGSEEQLTRAYRRLENDTTACEMGEAAYAKFWANPPTMEKHLDQLISIYERAVGHE